MSDPIYRVKISGVYSQEQKPGLQKSYLKGPNPTYTVNYYCWIQKKKKQKTDLSLQKKNRYLVKCHSETMEDILRKDLIY